MRFLLRRRDCGVCQICQVDTKALQAEYNAHCKTLPPDPLRPWDRTDYEWLKAHGIPAGRSDSDWWDADHITPVIEGGGECGLDNYRTLCIPCHRKVTKELHGRLKQKRLDAKILPLLQSAEEVADAQ